VELVVDARELKEWVYLLDKLVGTTEPTARFLSFFYRDGLWVSASDNCAKVEIFLGEIPRFEDSRIVSLDLVKYFLSDVKVSDVRITVLQERLVLKAGNEVLDVRCKTGEIPPGDGEEEFLCTLTKREFEGALNFASSNLDEGEFLILLFEEKDVLMFGASAGIMTLAQISTIPKKPFSTKIPYVTVRHIFKAFQRLDVQTLDFYEKSGKLVVKYPHFVMEVCGDEVGEEEIKKLRALLKEKTAERIDARRQVLAKLVRKAAVLSRGDYATISRRGESLKVQVKRKNLSYTAELFVESGRDFVVVFPSKKLRSALARMDTERIFLEITERFLKISNFSGTRVIYLELEEFF